MTHIKAGIIVAASLSLVAGATAASDWRLAVVDPISRGEMDVASLVRDGDIVKAWVRYVYIDPVDLAGKGKMGSRLSRVYFDCDERRMAIRQSTAFTDLGFENVLTQSPPVRELLLDWIDVAPDTSGESQLDFACSHARRW